MRGLLQVLVIRNGKAMYRVVSITGIAKVKEEAGQFLEIHLDSHHTLKASAGHYIPVGGQTIAMSSPHSMAELAVGDKLWVLPDNASEPVPAYVTKINKIDDQGGYKVHTASDGIVVDGVVAHEHSDNFPVRSTQVYKAVNYLPWLATMLLPLSVSQMVVYLLEFLGNAVNNLVLS